MIEVVDGQPAEAVDLCQQSLSTFNEWPFTYITLASAYAYLGRAEEAKATIGHVLELIPGLTISALTAYPKHRSGGRWQVVIEGLRRAGLPSG